MEYRICVWDNREDDLAWDGEIAHHELASRHAGSPMAPTMLAFLATLMAEWPTGQASGATMETTCTWPMALDAWGRVMCIRIEPREAEGVARRIVDMAHRAGLVVHVPRSSAVTLSARKAWELP